MDVVFVLLEALLWQLHTCSSAGRCAAARWPWSPWQPHPSRSPPGAPHGWIFIPLGPRGGLCTRRAAGLCWAQAAPARVQPICGCVAAGLAPGMRLVRVSPCPRCRGSEDGWRKRCVTPSGDGNTPTRRVSAPYKLPWAWVSNNGGKMKFSRFVTFPLKSQMLVSLLATPQRNN